MPFRPDVKYMLNSDWEPKVPSKETILKQAQILIKKGKSTGSVALDVQAMNRIKKDKIDKNKQTYKK